MTQKQLDREVAQKTGETRDLIRQRGFSMVVIPRQPFRPRRGPGLQSAKSIDRLWQPVDRVA